MAITTLRPNNDVPGKSANWKRSVAGSLFVPLAAATSSGSDYVFADAGMPQGVVWYAADLNGESITLAGRRVGFIQIRGDIQNPGDTGRTVQVRTSLRDLATAKNITPPDYLKSAQAGIIVARSGAKQYRNPDGKEWTQPNLNRLQVEFYSYRSANGYYPRLHRIFVDVDLKDRPVVSAVTLTNTSTTRPVVSGTFAATEGDPLTRARLRIFTAAQVAAAGFSPETSKATYDSGDQATVSLKLDVGQDLAPGVTYHAYLRGAYTLNATPFWSAYASSGAFLLAIEPATAPLLTMTADATLRRSILVYQGRVNLLSSDDSDFEGGPGNYTTGVGITAVARSTTVARHGAGSLQLTVNGTANPFTANDGNSAIGLIPTKAGQVFRLSGFGRAGTTGRAWRLVARYYTTVPAYHSQTNGTTVTTASGAWSALPDVTATAPVDGFLGIQMEMVGTPVNGELHRFDQMQIVPGSAAVVWSPGGYLPISTARIDGWDRSTGADNLARLELSATRDGIYKRTAADSLSTDPANTQQGADSMAWVPSATGSILDFGWPFGEFREDFALPGADGLVAIVSFYAQASVAGSYTLGIDCHDGAGGGVGTSSATIALTAGRQRFSFAMTLPAATINCHPFLINATGATSQTVWLSAFQWELRAAGSSTVPDPWVPGQGTAPDWQAVRGMGATLFSSSVQRFALSDFEPPPGIVRTYRAVVDTLLTGLETTLASTPIAASMAALWMAPSGVWYLKDPYFPERNAAVRVVGMAEAINPDVSVFQPAGLELPVAFWDAVGGIGGQITVVGIGDAEWARLRPILQAGSTMLLDLPEGGHRYLAITQAGWPRAGSLGAIQRQVALDVSEVRKPPDLASYSGLGFLSTSGGVVIESTGTVTATVEGTV